MAATRLRKTFKYPSDDEGSQHSRDELDEEEQENLISNLQSQSKTSNATYVFIFTSLPLLLTPLFTYHLIFSSSNQARIRLLSLLAITSLFASAFSMFFLSSIDGTDARARLDRRQKQLSRSTFAAVPHESTFNSLLTKVMDKLDDLRLDLDADGPLLRALPILNGVMSGLLAFAAWMLHGRSSRGVPEYMWLYLVLPGVMCGMTTIARRSIMSEERELRELRGLRYGYKGA